AQRMDFARPQIERNIAQCRDTREAFGDFLGGEDGGNRFHFLIFSSCQRSHPERSEAKSRDPVAPLVILATTLQCHLHFSFRRTIRLRGPATQDSFVRSTTPSSRDPSSSIVSLARSRHGDR